MRLTESNKKPLAISTEFLAAHPVYHGTLGERNFVVLTDESGVSRVYESNQSKFVSWDGNAATLGQQGNSWTVSEQSLSLDGQDEFKRLSSHRAFWFGWYAAHPDTQLVK